MKKFSYPRLVAALFIGSIVVPSTSMAQEDPFKDPLNKQQQDLRWQQFDAFQADLLSFMEKHKLTWDGLDVMYQAISGKVLYNQKTIPIDENVSIANDLMHRDVNTLIVKGKEWSGKKENEPEVVFTDGEKVYASLKDLPRNQDIFKLKVISFSRGQVRYIDFSNNSGGRFTRGSHADPW